MKISAILALLLPATLLTTATAPAAAADPAGALNRCQYGAPADYNAATNVLGNGGGSIPTGTNPPNVLMPGDAFKVRPLISDRVRVDLWGYNVGPDGNGTLAQGGTWPFQGLNQFAEVLRFNNNPGGWVGNPAHATAFQGCQTWNGGYPVRFLFYVNDAETWDNGGYWATNVAIWRANP
ncbi:hypothetical protein [Spongiactinospora rosea]|nr:hypothetical protein [Spongiactinospora rosea]